MERTHLVLCTPGSAGTMIAGGIAVVSGQVDTVDLKGEQRIGIAYLIGLQDGMIEPAEALQRVHGGSGGGRHWASAARSRSRTPVHVWVVDQPSTQAIGSSAVCCGIVSRAARSSSSRLT